MMNNWNNVQDNLEVSDCGKYCIKFWFGLKKEKNLNFQAMNIWLSDHMHMNLQKKLVFLILKEKKE